MPAKKPARKKTAEPASSADMSVVKPKHPSKTKAGKNGAKKAKGKVNNKTAHVGTPGGRQKGDKSSTIFNAPGPESPTNEKTGNFDMKPGVDIQQREPLAPTETRNTVVASSGNQKPETNIPRHMDNNGMDVAPVPPATVDQENKDAYDTLKQKAMSNDAHPQNRLNDGSAPKKD